MARLHFISDQYGKPPQGVELYPDTEYRAEPNRKRVADRLKSKSELADWISNAVLGDIRTLRLGIQEQEKRPQDSLGGGNFLALGACLMALEYFSKVFSEKNNAADCVKEYAAHFMKSITSNYANCWTILWPAARNGILHGSWPSRISLSDVEDDYIFDVGIEPTHPHLVIRDGVIYVNSLQLLNDLEASVENDLGFRYWVLHQADDGALERGQPFSIRIHSVKAVAAWGH